MNRKIVLSSLSILTALTMLSGSAFAAFQVNATSNGSTFSSGNPSLALCNDNSGTLGACAAQIPSPINVSNLVPGTPQTFAFWIQNSGTDTLTPLTGLFNSPSITGVDTLENDLNVGLVCDGTSNNGTIATDTFHNWEVAKTLAAGTLAPSAASRCVMTVELPSGNSADANQTLNFNAVFSGTDGT